MRRMIKNTENINEKMNFKSKNDNLSSILR